MTKLHSDIQKLIAEFWKDHDFGEYQQKSGFTKDLEEFAKEILSLAVAACNQVSDRCQGNMEGEELEGFLKWENMMLGADACAQCVRRLGGTELRVIIDEADFLEPKKERAPTLEEVRQMLRQQLSSQVKGPMRKGAYKYYLTAPAYQVWAAYCKEAGNEPNFRGDRVWLLPAEGFEL
jgi:hypothetical protein